MQTKNTTIDVVSKMLNGLYNSIQEIRDKNFEDSLKNAKNTAIEMKLSPEFLEKRRHKIKRMDGEKAIDEGATPSTTPKSKMIFTWQLTQSYRV